MIECLCCRAGTDANVFVMLYGTLGSTRDMPLENSRTYRNKFERGQQDVFALTALSVGDISKIRIRFSADPIVPINHRYSGCRGSKHACWMAGMMAAGWVRAGSSIQSSCRSLIQPTDPRPFRLGLPSLSP